MLKEKTKTIWCELRVALTACLVVASFALAGCGMQQGSGDSFNVQIGDAVPAFSLKDLDGNIVSSEVLLGKPYVVAIFATWCPPCEMELTALEKNVWQPLKDQGIGVVAINYGDEDEDLIRSFAQENGLSFPMLIDTEGSFRKKTGVTAIPQSIVVGADGRIINLHVGFTDESIASTERELKAAL